MEYLFKFANEQKIFEIGRFKIGGNPGQLPTVMIGSIFYHGDKLVKDEKEGIFEKNKAEKYICDKEEISEKTGNPGIIDVVGAWPEAINKYIDFIADSTDMPFLVDGTTSEVRMTGAKHVAEVGLLDRAIFNTIMPETKTEELECIKESGIKSAILLILNSRNPTIQGRIEVLDECLDKAKKAGIENYLVDATILDMPDPGPVGKTIYLIKEKYGLPAGCGAHNAVDQWHHRKKLDPTTYLTSGVVANVVPITMGADFLLYGPIKNSHKAYVPCAVADAYVAYSVGQEYGTRPLEKNHPLYRVFREIGG